MKKLHLLYPNKFKHRVTHSKEETIMKPRNTGNAFLNTYHKLRTLGVLMLGILILACGDSSETLAKLEKLEKKLEKIEQQTRFVALRVGWEDPDAPAVEIPIGDSYYQGADNPILTLVEFSDFECPYCAQAAPVLDRFVRDNADKVQLVFKHFPLGFHKKAMSAHVASLAAGKQGRFFEYRYRIAPYFRNLGDSLYMAAARDLNLDLDAFEAALKDDVPLKKQVEVDMLLGREIGVQGTPTLYANGRLVKNRSYQGLEALLKQVEQEIGKK
jgi:protein-disulfide isomerase